MNQEQEYIKWKRWCKDDFAKLSKNEELYFDKEIFSAKKNPKSIFEIGFGNGHFYSWCYKNHIEYAGTEINKVLLDMANRNKIKVFYTLDDINEKFDMVVAFDVFEHMTNEDIISTLIKIKKNLSKDGLVLLRFPNADSFLSQMVQYGDPTHINYIGFTKIEFLAKQAGFCVIKYSKQKFPILHKNIFVTLKEMAAACTRFLIENFVSFLIHKRFGKVTSVNAICILASEN